MKKLIFILTIISAKLFAQSETDCPFAAQKYVHYDGIIESSSFYLPTQYQQLLQNNNAYDRDISHLNSSAKADCFYKTSIHNHDSIMKPFVFVEGISFEKISANDNSYNMGDYFRQDWAPSPPAFEPECLESFNSAPQHLGSLVGYSTFNWATLVTGIDAEGYHVGDPLKVEKAPELLNRLCCAGYDICFVDFHSGEAYIESNGEALYSILVQLHQKLVDNNSTEKMVVCGASMGGLVARYAINKLEAEGHTDWVEKFISFDSPQMGANIPLGVQYTLKHLKGLGSDLEEKYSKLTCPSASQLVNYSCLETNLGSPIVYTTPTPSIERNELLSNPYMGWPKHCTKIAISNGSKVGFTQSTVHQPGDKVLDINGMFDLDLYSLPQNNSNYQKVFDFDPPYCLLNLFSLIGPGGITQQSVRVQNTMALDLAAGSFRTDLKDLENQLPSIVTNAVGQVAGACNLGWIDDSNNNDKLCFIPLMSSIGIIEYETIMKSNQAITQTLLNGLFGSNYKFEDYSHQYSHFDVVYAPLENQSHVEITNENIEWLIQELTGMPEHLVHQNRTITSNTYKASISISAGNNIFNNPICNVVNNGSNNSPILPQLNPCGDAVVGSYQQVYYKAGQFIELMPGFYTDDNAFFLAEIHHYPSCYSNGRTSAPSPQSVTNSAIFNDELNLQKNTNLKTQTDLANNSILLFPNPASHICDIKSNENIELITVYTVMGKLISREQVNEKNYQLATSELAEGMYLVNIKTNSENNTKKLMVKHE
jgi:hypothetical protein